MTAREVLCRARLGENSSAFAAAFGGPYRVESHGAGVVRWYSADGVVIVVTFTCNQAVALHCAYAGFQLQRGDLTTLVRAIAGTEPVHVYLADGGFILATASCSRSVIELLASLTGSLRPELAPRTLLIATGGAGIGSYPVN